MAKIDKKVKNTSTKHSKKLWILPVAVGSVAAVLIGLFTWQVIENNKRGGATHTTCKLKFDSDNCKLLSEDNQEIKTIDLEAGKPYKFKIEQTDYELFDAPNNISMSSLNDNYIYNYSNGEITLTINEDATLGAIAPYAATHFIGFGAQAFQQGNGFNHITFGDTDKYPFSIDWGDGDVIEYDPNDPDVDYYNEGVSHEYKQDGTYDITIYGAVNSIVPKGRGLRAGCPNIIFGDKIKYIEDGSYANCFYQDVYISDGIKVIGDEAFRNCPQLKSVYLPSTLDYLGNDSFECANPLKEVRIAPNTNLSVLANNREYPRDKRLFYNVFAYNSSGGIHLESIYIGRNSIFDMQDNEFNERFGTLKSIIFEDDDCDMIRLPKNTFSNNQDLTSFTCPKSVTYIDDGAFNQYSGQLGLKIIKLSPNLKYIKNRAFAGDNLSRIEFTSKKPPTIDPNTFSNLNDPFKIVVPKGCAQSYINTWRGVIDESCSKILLYIEEADL